MRKLIIIFLILFVLGVLFTISYDIYSYHIAAYYSLKIPFSQIYNKDLYFDRFPDYPPLGVFLNIFIGKIISFIYPLSINNVKILSFYKFLPILFLIFLFRLIEKNIEKDRLKYLFILILIFFPISVLMGQTDSILLFFVFYSILLFDSGRYKEGIIISILNLAIKQTSLFFSLFILLYYFLKSDNKKKYFFFTLLSSIGLFIIICAPFILAGNFINFLHDFTTSTVSVISPLSIQAFNILGIINNAYLIDFNHKIFLFSIKTYSLIIIFFFLFFINIYYYKKKNILELLVIFIIIWYNIQVGLHSTHIIFPVFVLFLYVAKYNKGKIFLYIFICLLYIDILFNSSIITMKLFNYPNMKYLFIQIFSIIQVIISILTIYWIIKNKEDYKIIYKTFIIDYKILYSIILLFVIITIILPGRIKKENELMSYLIINNELVDYDKEHYMGLDLYRENILSYYLSVRMSDQSFFYFNPEFKKIYFFATMEYGDSGKLIINNDTFNISKNKQYIEYNIQNDKMIKIYSLSNKKFSQIVLYNLNYE